MSPALRVMIDGSRLRCPASLIGHVAEGVSIGLYSAERTIVDVFRLRGLEGHDVAYEALRRWLRRRGAAPRKLLDIAKQLPRAEGPLLRALEVLG